MATYIMKLHDERDGRDWYLEWSTEWDAPSSKGMTLEEFKVYYRALHGESGTHTLPARLERVEAKGISALPPHDDLDDYFEWNRAGENETTLDKYGIIDRYCRGAERTEPGGEKMDRRGAIRDARAAVARLRDLGDSDTANQLAGAIDYFVARARLVEDEGAVQAVCDAMLERIEGDWSIDDVPHLLAALDRYLAGEQEGGNVHP